ncbi:hypothetical protein NE237_018258 [Protea cynaroides]|uniref:Endoglucanase n=1 Tax=Protea cynaroides TaxID=273540 RepID=A0A9Q0K9L1_9MAGN|nr:hypothetical protein NE237_018258 [Protea cynaroides]
MGADSKSKGGCCGWFVVFVIAAATAIVLFVVEKKSHLSNGGPAPVPGPPGAVVQKYGDALKLAVQFFDVQKSGKLVNNKISWRGDSGLKDGKEEGLDLSKGMYDAGDHVKFGFPMAFTATVLSWTILEYGDQMSAVKQLEPARESLKWITDFLINAHPSENVLYIQVGDAVIDHKCWERPETMLEKRPLTQVNTSSPGTEVAAETAAAMAAASLVFKTIDSTYSGLLLKHAKQLFTFANTYKGSYSVSIPEVQTYYNSTGYEDELLWAASWLYHATGDYSYLKYVTVQHGKAFADWGNPTWFSWDNKLPGTQVLLSRLNIFGAKDASDAENSGLQKYRKTAEAVMCNLLPDSPSATKSRTDGGIIWVSEWDSLQHTVASAFLAVLYSDYMLTSQTAAIDCDGDSFTPLDIRKFATSQADYVLGNNPMKMSYLVGYGSKYPQYIHHRGASIPADADTGCNGFKWLSSTEPNPNVAVGALVGGPFLNETYIDSRNNSMQGEPTTYNSAFVVGLLSGLVTTSSVSGKRVGVLQAGGSENTSFRSRTTVRNVNNATGTKEREQKEDKRYNSFSELRVSDGCGNGGRFRVSVTEVSAKSNKHSVEGGDGAATVSGGSFAGNACGVTLLTYLKSKARIMAVPHLAHTACGIRHQEGMGLVDKSGTPFSEWSRHVDLSSFDCGDEETLTVISNRQGSIDERDGAYIGEILKSIRMVTDVMEALVKRVIMAETETAIEKENVSLGQAEIKKKALQIESMSVKVEEMERFALGTNCVLNEMRQKVEDMVQETSTQRQRAVENEQELCRVKQDFESLKSYVSSLISVRETLLSSEKQFQTIEKLFDRLVAKTSHLESEKMRKEAEVQKLMEENVRLSALLDKKEAQLLAMNEQCKVMALTASASRS